MRRARACNLPSWFYACRKRTRRNFREINGFFCGIGPWVDVASQETHARPATHACGLIEDTEILAAVVVVGRGASARTRHVADFNIRREYTRLWVL